MVLDVWLQETVKAADRSLGRSEEERWARESGVTLQDATLVGLRRSGHYVRNLLDVGSENQLSLSLPRSFTRRHMKRL